MLIWLPRHILKRGNISCSTGGFVSPLRGYHVLCLAWPGMMIDMGIIPAELYEPSNLPLGTSQVAGWTAFKWEIEGGEACCFMLPGLVPDEFMRRVALASLDTELSRSLVQETRSR